ncbi:MAG: hypothetical protein LBD41_04350 [Clostridiales Family XIII bacterium]|jgi:hypothetical protein|nr:hypothetical protein [Clostridiales Family XIII bacterium]
MEAWQTYLRRDLVEKCFDNLIDITSTNSFIPNTNNRIEIKIFLHFLSAIITSQIKNTIKNDQKLRMFSPKYLLHNISTLRKNYLEGIPQEFYSEINDLQKHILDVFGLKWPA